jgi:hypothetical protein
MQRGLVLLALAAALGLAAVFVVLPRLSGPDLPPLPASEQTLERHEIAPQLRRRIEQALEAQGLTTSPQSLITVGPQDCPAACDTGMDRGLCYCLRDAAQNCPAGWPLEQGNSRSACASLPDRVRVRPDGPESAEQVISF